MADNNKFNTTVICALILCVLTCTSACINIGRGQGETREKVRTLELNAKDYVRRELFDMAINNIDHKFDRIITELEKLNKQKKDK